MNHESVVIGIGNPFRQDDGVGHVVADEVARRHIPGVHVITAIGEPGEILDAWRDVARAVVVDAAVSTGMTPGRIHRWTPGEIEVCGVVSSHTLGVAQTFALAQALGQVPRELVVFSIGVAEVGHGVGLTTQVAAAVPLVVDAIHAEVSTPPRQ
jgi:hydrogenase maturation protease